MNTHALISLLAAMLLLTSCGQHLFDSETSSSSNYGLSIEASSSSLESSSSSKLQSSSSSAGANGTGPSFTYEGKTYNTVKIGNQTWMAKNLNYRVPGSKCGWIDGFLKDDDNEYCEKYGRLYNWATAMDIPSKCNNLSISDPECAITPYHRGVCPAGWHIPTKEEWEILISFTGGDTAAINLKATEGWGSASTGYCGPSGSGKEYLCEDKFGFNAIPIGIGSGDERYNTGCGYEKNNFNSTGNFCLGSTGGHWWTSTEFRSNKDYAYWKLMNSDKNKVNPDGSVEAYKKIDFLSLRCIQDDSNSGNFQRSSSSRQYSSSSSLSSSSVATCGGKEYDTATEYCSNGALKKYGSVYDDAGQNYKTVAIGPQTWMAENINYNVLNSKCGGTDGLLKDENTIYCEKYGRLYNWATAMDLPAKCNSVLSSRDAGCTINTPHRGICPSGWHLPSQPEWIQLFRFADNMPGASEFYTSRMAGEYLKAKDGWHDCGGYGKKYSCMDLFGFTALPGGNGNSDGYFGYAGYLGYWWNSSEYNDIRAKRADMSYNVDPAYASSSEQRSKSDLYSVRCIQNDPAQQYSSSSSRSSSSSVATCGKYDSATQYCSNGALKDYGYVQDNGGQTYKTVAIGDQTWMAENLNYDGANGDIGKCYDCAKYGRLYSWATAMGLSRTYDQSSYNPSATTNYRGICPEGWHIPNNAEWNRLYHYADGTANSSSNYTSPTAGSYLKAAEGWESWNAQEGWYDCEGGNGEDKFGFAALPGGYADDDERAGGAWDDQEFYDIGSNGSWWSSSEDSGLFAYSRDLHCGKSATLDFTGKGWLLSIRCIKD